MEITNIPQYHEVNPLSLMQHAKQTKITLFEALRAWLDDEIVADSWLDAYQVIRDSLSIKSRFRLFNVSINV